MNGFDERLDTFIEQLREDAKCGSGSKPCGKICIPQEKNCGAETAKAFGGGAVQALAGPIGSGTYRALRKRGHRRASSIAGGVGASLAAGAATIAVAGAIGKSVSDRQYTDYLDKKYGITDKQAEKMVKDNPKISKKTAYKAMRETAHIIETPEKGGRIKRLAGLQDKYKL